MGRVSVIVGAVGAIIAAVAAASARADIRVSFVGPLTGEMELAGEQMANGAELAVAELNSSGGVLGQKLVLDLVDDHCDVEQGPAAARKVVADGVAVAVGHVCSGAAIPASGIYEAARVPLLTLAANPLLTGRGLRFTFRTSPADDTNAKFAAEHMVRRLAAERIAVVHDTRVYGQGLAELVRTKLEELGTPAVLFAAAEPGQLVYTSLIARMRAAGVDVLYYGGYPREIGLLRRQMAEAGFLPTTIIAGAGSSEEYSLIAGRAAEGTLVVADRPFTTAEFSRFAAKFREVYQIGSDLRSTRGYASVMIWAQAVGAAGTTDGTAVAQALRSETFGVFGVEARFDNEGNVKGPLGEAALWVWHDGRPVSPQSDPRSDYP